MRWSRIRFCLRRSSFFIPLVALAASAAAAAAPPGWTVARSPHFIVVTNAGESQARLVAHQFEQLRGLLQSVVKVRVESPRPLIALALRNEGDLKELLPAQYAAKGRALPAGMFVRGNDVDHVALRVDAQGVGRFHIIYHEYLHLLNALNFRQLPLWLNEGLAEFYATADIDDNEVRFGQVLPWHVELLRRGAPLPLDRLFAVDGGSDDYTKAHRVGVFYAQSAALTHYFLMGDRGAHRQALADYVTLSGNGVPEPEARQRAFGDLKQLERDFGRYVRQIQFFGARAQVRLDPTSIVVRPLSEAEALALRADFALHSGQRTKARALTDAALQLDAGLALAHRVRGMSDWYDGRRREGLAELERALVLAPQDYVGLYRLGAAVLPDEDADARVRRERSLRRALELNPGYVPAQAALATLLERTGRAEEALAHAREAAAREPNEAAWSLRLMSVLKATGRGAEAESVERELVQAAHADPGILTQVTFFYEEAGRLADAEALLLKVRATQPGQPRVLAALGNLLARLEKYDEAETTYREALKLRADDPELLNNLGFMNADRNVRVSEALGLIDKALKRVPDVPAYLDSRGWALFRLGRLTEAERVLRQALDGQPSAALFDHLGDVLAARGAAGEAAETWRRALEQNDVTAKLRQSIGRKLAPPERPS